MRLAVIILVVLVLSGCATQKRCYEKWSMKPDTITKVVTRDSLIYRDWETDRKSTRLNSSHSGESRMPSSA